LGFDVTVFRDDLGQGYSFEELEGMSRKKRDRALDDIKAACEHYINGDLLERLKMIAAEAVTRTGIAADNLVIEPNPDDSQSLLIRYPTVTPADDYIDKIVKIESGAKSALDPNSTRSIVPGVGYHPKHTPRAWQAVLDLFGETFRAFDARGELVR
jgi:Nucleotidyl transferase AbiEii toxin, Type IV TA system